MTNSFHLKINTPRKVCFDDDIIQVELCTNNGYIGILPNHIPIIGSLVPGNIIIHTENNTIKKGIHSYGLFQFKNDNLNIVTDNFSFDGSINKKDHQDILNLLKEIKLDAKSQNNFEIYFKKSFAKLSKD